MTASRRLTSLGRGADHWVGRFTAMASPCEVLVEAEDDGQARAVLDAAAACAWRIEDKFSRYRDDNIVHALNTAQGRPTAVDEETANLIDFAAHLHHLSEGLFDITSGVLRRAWRFDGHEHVHDPALLAELLQLVGWDKVQWQRPVLTLRKDMQIDFGGIGKEYAVDRAMATARELTQASCLVNFGGDLAVTGPRRGGRAWQVGVEAVNAKNVLATTLIELFAGALATSGDTYRFITHDGRRLGHILDPRTGWPVEGAPRCITVAADTCTQAGMFTTLAMLQGSGAEAFLETEGLRHWVQR